MGTWDQLKDVADAVDAQLAQGLASAGSLQQANAALTAQVVTLTASGTALQAALDAYKASHPDPAPPVDPPPTGTGSKVYSMWHYRWSPAPNLRDWPSDVKAKVNHVVLGLAQGNSGDGNMEYTPNNGQSIADCAADVREFRSRGINVAMGFGGAGGNIRITNETQVTQALNCIIGFVNTYGINGFDVDIESPTLWNKESLNSLARQAKAKYGSKFIVGLTPGLWGERTALWMACARLMGSNYDYMSPMLYDFPEAGDSRITAVWRSKVQTMLDGGIPQNKIILGAMMRPDPGYLNATPNPALIIDAWNSCEATWPNLLGVFEWEDRAAKSRGWDLVRAAITANQP